MNDDTSVPASTPLSAWLDRLAQADGEPGGGAASGVMLGLSAALLRMVAEYTRDDERAAACAGRLAILRRQALDEAEADGVKSAALGAALRLPDDDDHRDDKVRVSAIAAAESSAAVGRVGIALLAELRMMADIGNPHLAADLVVAGEALAAGLAGASVNLRANLQLARRHRVEGDDADHALRGLDGEAVSIREARAAASAIAWSAAAVFDR